MEEQLIPAEMFCSSYNVEYAFIHSLQEQGLIQVTTVEEKVFIHPQQLEDVERFIRLHYDLDINLAGIEAISHLLSKVKEMQDEMNALKNRLRMYEM